MRDCSSCLHSSTSHNVTNKDVVFWCGEKIWGHVWPKDEADLGRLKILMKIGEVCHLYELGSSIPIDLIEMVERQLKDEDRQEFRRTRDMAC